MWSPPTQIGMVSEHDMHLHRDLRMQTRDFAERISGPMVAKAAVVDGLLDLRNLGRGRDLGLELTVDEMLEEIPAGRQISSEWWMNCLNTVADHANFLAAGYPAAIPALAS